MSKRTKFENSLKFTRFLLLVSGINISKQKYGKNIEKFLKILYYVNTVVLHTVLFGEIIWVYDGYQNNKGFVELSSNLPLMNISYFCSIKSYIMFTKSDVIRLILNTLESIHPEQNANESENTEKSNSNNEFENGTETDENQKTKTRAPNKRVIENAIANESLKMLSVVSSILFLVSALVLFMFCLAPLLSMVVIYYNTGEFKVVYPFGVVYWFDVYETQFWYLLYMHQVLATAVVCCNMIGSEVLFYILCSYLEMHFRILCGRFEDIGRDSSGNVKNDLVKAVERHQKLICIAELAEQVFSIPGLFNIVSSSLIICLSAFNITMANDIKTLCAFVTFLNLNLCQVSLLCFFGNKLMESSSKVTRSIYQCPWYNFSVNTRKDILFILMRAGKPCKLTAANFADLNLRAFTTILSRSWSYFALLKTVYK